jgi:alpha-D-ribose 1-methylphosphonate 5-triphosphate synthase subunit PhnL
MGETRSAPLLRIEHLTKAFTLHVLHGKRVPAFHDVSFTVPRGKITAIVGPSGSGKSSLLKCIYRTYLPTSGSILLATDDGLVDLAAADDHMILALRKRTMGYVSQFLKAPPRVTAVEVVARPLIERGIHRAAALAEAAAILERLHLPPDLFDAYPSLFSGGEQQRVNIARALVAETDVLLLDEPTSALDRINLERVTGLLSEARARGTTILGIFHDYAVVKALADFVVVMEDGTVRSAGPWSSVPDEYRAGPSHAA